ncbi:hypothetical protein LDENG_00252980 [Lucifuga dentata]|nr:hypothetical protein LDENG_00252980 [Lucifuga dentata]
MLSPTLYSLYTYDRTPAHPTNTIIKFEDDTTVSAYRDEVQRLARWCSVNNLTLNTKNNPKELIIDFRKCRTDPLPVFINGDRVERVESSATHALPEATEKKLSKCTAAGDILACFH